MVKSLFDICLTAVCQDSLCADLALLPCDCKQKILEFFASHDQIGKKRCVRLMSRPMFGRNLTRLHFYLSEQLTDDILEALTSYNQCLRHIALIECPKITDKGVVSVTKMQKQLNKLELVGLAQLTFQALKFVKSSVLHTVDLSGCSKINSQGIFYLVCNNPAIKNLCLNGCRSLDEQALYNIARGCGPNLCILELDHLHNSRMIERERAAAIHNLSRRCPNISQLSLCRFFGQSESEEDDEDVVQEYRIEGVGLREVDLYGNFFATLPYLPPTICSIRLSVTGQEDVIDLIKRLGQQSQLVNIHLQLFCSEEDAHSIEQANHFLCTFIPYMGSKITRLHVSVQRLVDTSLQLITQSIPNLSHLALDVAFLNANYLRRFFAGGNFSRGSRLRSLRLCRLRITYRALFAIGRCARSLVELETSHMPCVDDRFLALLAKNCKSLTTVNFNGCKWVTDKGLAALARNCQLKEVRIRATACTDKSIYILAQFCPTLEWIAHADFSGRPKFSDQALKCLRDSCIQRVIC